MGEFRGDVVTKWNFGEEKESDRVMILTDSFSFIDNNQEEWIANKGNPINGASIPEFLWGELNLKSPYIGNYRRAAALHDSLYFDHHSGVLVDEQDDQKKCDIVFYRAMYVDNTPWFQRKIMFIAVRLFGRFYWDSNSVKTIEELNFEDKERYDAAVDEAGELSNDPYEIDGITFHTEPDVDGEIDKLNKIIERYKN